jgi:PAS domain S-box-containing protein
MNVHEAQPAQVAVPALTDALPHLVWVFAADLRLEYANDRFVEFTGLSIEEARASGDRMALVHPDDIGTVKRLWSDARVRRAALELDVRLRRADGRYRLMQVRFSPAFASDGQNERWLAIALDVEDERRRELLVRGIIETAPQMIWVCRPDGFIEFWNKRLRDYTGMTPNPEGGIDWSPVIHPDDLERVTARYMESLRDETHFDLQYRLRRHDGVYRWFLARAEPARDSDGKVIRWIGTATDIDDQKREEDARTLLLDATGILAERRELENALADVCALVVGSFSQTCSLYRRTPRDEIVCSVIHARDSAKAATIREMLRMYPIRSGDPIARVLEKNQPMLFPRIDVPVRELVVQDPRHRAMLETIDARSGLIVPLSAHGEAIGALQFARFAGDPPFDERDLATARILANRLAGAIDEAMTREGERRLAETFQSSALPRRLPDLPGIEVRAIYQAAEVGINVGGDWYDAFELSPWRLVVSIGDVAGKGADAAATMSLIRHGIRFAAHRGQDPADILGVVDNALRAESADLTATAFVAIVDIRESRVRYATAGHPPAALRLPNGRVRMLDVEAAPPLGAWPEGLRPRVEASPLVYGSLLVLYTDGLTEVDRDPIGGERRLIGALHDEAVFASTNPARYVRDAIIEGRTVRDDVAVITLAYGRRRGWTFEASDALRAQPARASFERWLAEEAEGDLYGSVLVFGELVGNVVRHAPGPIEMRAEWRDDELVLHVFDAGPGFQLRRTVPDTSSEGGRGLFIVSTLANDVTVASTPRGTRISVRLPVTRKPLARR